MDLRDNTNKSINDYLCCFQKPELAEAWARVIRDDVYPYMKPLTEGRKNGGKMLWKIVLDESFIIGVLKNNLKHQDAAKLLAVACPGCFEDVEALKNSLDAYSKKAHQRANYKREADFGSEIREKLRACISPKSSQISVEATLADHAYHIAQKLVDFGYNSKSCRVRRAPKYQAAENHIVTPAISIETFPDEKAFMTNEPSSVVSFECVEDGVSDSRIEMLNSKYGHFSGRHHLIIITRVGFKSGWAEQLCKAYNMGLWIVHNDGSYERVLSRSVNEFAAREAARRALFGGASTGKDIVFADDEFMTLPELLVDWGVRIKRGFILQAPVYSQQEIKDIATDHLSSIGFKRFDYTVNNIERLAELFDFTWETGPLMNHQLGICNFDENHIIISDTLRDDPHRWRFTFGHDSGHYILQKESVAPFINKFGESEETLLTCNFRREELRWLEWQANQYARYLLMPDEMMKNLIFKCYDYRMKRKGLLYVDNQQCNLEAYNEVMHEMSRLANVSMQALHYRLIEMGMLQDERKPERPQLQLPEFPW